MSSFHSPGERTQGPQKVLPLAGLSLRQMHFDRRTTARNGRPGKSSSRSSDSFLDLLRDKRVLNLFLLLFHHLPRSLSVDNKPRRNARPVSLVCYTRMRCTTTLAMDPAATMVLDGFPTRIQEHLREDSLMASRRRQVILIRPITSPVQLVSGSLYWVTNIM